MRIQPTTWGKLVLMVCLGAALCGCGGGESDPQTKHGPAPDDAVLPGEVVVEPSEQSVEIEGESRDTVSMVRGLLTDGGVDAPVGYTLKVDDAFGQAGRVRFWVAPADLADEEADKAAADGVYDALAEAFEQRMAAALQTQLDEAKREAGDAAERTQALQTQLRVFQESRRGLGATDASRLERRRIERALESALERQIEINKTVETLQRRHDRGRVTELYRIR